MRSQSLPTWSFASTLLFNALSCLTNLRLLWTLCQKRKNHAQRRNYRVAKLLAIPCIDAGGTNESLLFKQTNRAAAAVTHPPRHCSPVVGWANQPIPNESNEAGQGPRKGRRLRNPRHKRKLQGQKTKDEKGRDVGTLECHSGRGIAQK